MADGVAEGSAAGEVPGSGGQLVRLRLFRGVPRHSEKYKLFDVLSRFSVLTRPGSSGKIQVPFVG